MIGAGIVITVCEFKGNCVRIGIDAPPDVKILRGELAEAERIARIKADHNTVRCPHCQSPTVAVACDADIMYACCQCDWAITQPAVGDPEELAMERHRSLRHGPHEQMKDPMEHEPRRRPDGP
jgi:carbon storage regulator CsrA